MDRKGIGAVITFALIIGFAVVLSALIFEWGDTFAEKLTRGTEESSEEANTCFQNIDIVIRYSCYNSTGNYTDVQVENFMEDELSGLAFRTVFTDRSADVTNIDSGSTDPEIVLGSVPLEGFGLDLYRIKYDGEKTPSEIHVLPKITLRDGKQVTCEKKLAEKIIYSECV